MNQSVQKAFTDWLQTCSVGEVSKLQLPNSFCTIGTSNKDADDAVTRDIDLGNAIRDSDFRLHDIAA